MKILRELQVGDEIFVVVHDQWIPRLMRTGTRFEYQVPKNRKTPNFGSLNNFYGLIVSNTDSVLTVLPSSMSNAQDPPRIANAVLPYNYLRKVLVFTGQTNEATVKTGRLHVGGSTVSGRFRQAWSSVVHGEVLPLMDNPHAKPAERLYEEVLIA